MASSRRDRPAAGVDLIAGISAQRFHDEYYAANEPVVLAGFLEGWPAFGKWTPAYLAERFGDHPVEIMTGLTGNPHYQRDPSRSRRTMRMREFVELVEREPESGDCYLAAQNQALRQPALAGLWDDLSFPPAFFDAESRANRVSLWFGPANTVTPLHYDLQNTLLAQVCGRKRVILISPSETGRLYNERGGYSEVDPECPDLDRFPLFGDVVTRTVDLEPGDAVFLPVRWWHHVRSLSVSISLSLGNFVWPNSFPSVGR